MTIRYDSLAAWATMIGEDDAGAGAPSRRQLTARGRAVSIANLPFGTRDATDDPDYG
jgi:hypothetical protein